MAGFRRSFEQRIGPFVVLVSGMPKVVPFLLIAVLLVGGLLAQGAVGGVMLLVLATLLGCLLVLAWPALLPGPRRLRLGVVLVVAVRGVLFLV